MDLQSFLIFIPEGVISLRQRSWSLFGLSNWTEYA